MKRLGGKQSVGGDAIYLTVSRIAVSLIGLVTSMLLARFRTLEEYGTYSQIIMVTDLVSTILMLGLPNSINYFLAKADTDKEKQQFMSIYVTLSTVLTIVISVCLFSAIPLIIRYFNNPALTAFAYVFAIYPWSSIMINSLANTCVVYGKANRLIVFNCVHAISTLLILLLAKVFDMSFRQYMVLYMASTLLFALVALGWISKMVGAIRVFLSKEIIKEIFVFSIPMGLASVVGTLNTELGKLVIGKFYSTEEYAIYANAAKELPVTMLATSMTAVLLPKLVRLLRDERNGDAAKLWGCALNLSFCFMCLIAGGFFVFAPDVMSLFYSEKYVTDGGVAVFRICSCILLLRATYWGIVLNATGKTRFILYSSIITLILNLIGNIAFCYFFGFVGPALSNLTVITIMAIIQIKFSTHVIKVPFSKILPWKDILRLLVQTFCFAVAFGIIKYNLLGTYTRNWSIVIAVLLGCIWAILYTLINIKFVKRNWSQLNT